MNKFMIELYNVPHEIMLYHSELKVYGDITYYSERFPAFIWLESMWDQDIIEQAMGVKKVYPKRPNSTHSSAFG